jgi:hypothetical protein
MNRAPGVIARTIAGETILVPVRRRAQEMGLFTLNAVGTFVWERLDGQRPLAGIASEVAEAFLVDRARAAEDVVAFASELERTGCAVPTAEEAR